MESSSHRKSSRKRTRHRRQRRDGTTECEPSEVLKKQCREDLRQKNENSTSMVALPPIVSEGVSLHSDARAPQPSGSEVVTSTPALSRVVNYILEYLLASNPPQHGTNTNATHFPVVESVSDADPVLPTHPQNIANVQTSLEFYLSDSNVLRDPYLLQRLGVRPSVTEHLQDQARSGRSESVPPSSEEDARTSDVEKREIWETLFVNKLSSIIKTWEQPTAGAEKSLAQDLAQHLKEVITADEWTYIMNKNPSVNYSSSCLSDPVYNDGFVWIAASDFVSFPKLKALGTTVEDIVVAAQRSTVIRAAFFPTDHAQADNMIDTICTFITGKDWDRSCLGRSGIGALPPKCSPSRITENPAVPNEADTEAANLHPTPTADPQASAPADVQDVMVAMKSLASVLGVGTAVRNPITRSHPHHPSARGVWRIGRSWDSVKHLEAVEDAVHARTVFVDNLPFRCSPDALRSVVEQQAGVAVVHVRIPRFVVSRENKGFGFVELEHPDHVPLCVSALHNCWPEAWAATLSGDNSKPLIRRNRRPLFACTHAEWVQRKGDLKKHDILGCLRNEQLNRNLMNLSSSHQTHWVSIENIIPPVSTWSIAQYVEHAVLPLKIYYRATATVALVQLAHKIDVQRLCFDVAVCNRPLGTSTQIRVREVLDPFGAEVEPYET